MKERRRFPRCARELYLILYVDGDTVFKAMTLDISCGGLRLRSPRGLQPGTIIAFKPQEEVSSQGISGTGEVMWCNHSAQSDSFEFGVAFPVPMEFRA
ncbi:MAG TPA: PilZ domain-containing protein [Desulfobacteraceae bacterium]|nr:PilZ domain-containing protein [Desulfobacteraceae bacterium]